MLSRQQETVLRVAVVAAVVTVFGVGFWVFQAGRVSDDGGSEFLDALSGGDGGQSPPVGSVGNTVARENVDAGLLAVTPESAVPLPPTITSPGDPNDAARTGLPTVPVANDDGGGGPSITPGLGATPDRSVQAGGSGESTTVPGAGGSSSSPPDNQESGRLEQLQLNAVELELFRLTNLLRTNPTGSLARQAPMPACIRGGVHMVEIDPTTGHPKPVSPLILDEHVSLEMARPWSEEMDRRDAQVHRPNQIDFYHSINVFPQILGENVAWASGYTEQQVALVHFINWRESATSHYCAMMSPVFTHVGVGHYTGSAKAWATQNFYGQ